MAETTQEEFKFPDEQAEKPEKEQKLQFEVEGDAEIEVVDDTPEPDRDRSPMKEPPSEVTDEELSQYSDGVKKRIQHFSKGYHEERRAKEAAMREKEEAIRVAQKLMEENKKLQSTHGQTQQVLLDQAKKVVANEVEEAKRKYKAAYESGDPDALVAAQDELTTAKIKADLAVHKKLVEGGVDTNSDQYFERINARMRQVFPDAFPSEKPVIKTSPVVAPATRSTAPKKIVLTKSQVNIAKRLGLTNEQYARAIAEQMRNQNG
jgi:hypothetical protein